MKNSLLEELGGRDAIEGVVAIFYARVLGDEELARFFRGVSMARLQQLQTDFFCAVLGETAWQGRDLATVHHGMHISDRQFDRVAYHLRASLEDASVPPSHVDAIITTVATLRPQIVSTEPTLDPPFTAEAPRVAAR